MCSKERITSVSMRQNQEDSKTKGTRGKFQKESEGRTRLECSPLPPQLSNIPLIKHHSPPFLRLSSGATAQTGGAVPCREATTFPSFPWTQFDFISDFSASQTVICCSLEEDNLSDLSPTSISLSGSIFSFIKSRTSANDHQGSFQH